ncbi:hypothetical protein EDB83DRAFT_2327238 [Lactarius deliciosus]|nr:hypothetical protein EDB83DRAFT_2327238 [Lactarius deliciosus]
MYTTHSEPKMGGRQWGIERQRAQGMRVRGLATRGWEASCKASTGIGGPWATRGRTTEVMSVRGRREEGIDSRELIAKRDTVRMQIRNGSRPCDARPGSKRLELDDFGARARGILTAHAPYACEGAAAVNAGDRVGERLTIVHGGAQCRGRGRGGRGGREEWSRGDLILTELGSEGEGEGSRTGPIPANSGTSSPPLLPPPASLIYLFPFPCITRHRALWGTCALPLCLGHHVHMGLTPPGPSLPNICPIRVEMPLPAGARRTACPPPVPFSAGDACPAPPRPALLGAGHQPNPKRPARIRERRDGAPTPPRGPHQSSPPPPAHTRGRVGASTPSARAMPARRLCTPPRLCTPGDARGSGESDGEGVVNEVKRSQGEAAHANGGHPAPVD